MSGKNETGAITKRVSDLSPQLKSNQSSIRQIDQPLDPGHAKDCLERGAELALPTKAHSLRIPASKIQNWSFKERRRHIYSNMTHRVFPAPELDNKAQRRRIK